MKILGRIIKRTGIIILSIIGMLFSALLYAEVDINKATVKEISSLEGIGAKKAQAIVDYRKENGEFRSIKELEKVKGLSKKSVAKLKDKVTIGTETTKKKTTRSKKAFTGKVNINTASEKELMQVSGIGKKKARIIIKSREKEKFSKVEDLAKEKGFSKKFVKKISKYLTVE